MQKQEHLAPAYAYLQKEWNTTIKKDSETISFYKLPVKWILKNGISHHLKFTLEWSQWQEPSWVLPEASELQNDTEILQFKLSKWNGPLRFLKELKVQVDVGLCICSPESLTNNDSAPSLGKVLYAKCHQP